MSQVQEAFMRNTKLRFFLHLILLVLLFPILTEADEDTGILRATLANGLRVVIVRNTLAPVVTTQVNYLVGSNEAPDGFPGMAHAQEHMMFRGSPGLSAAQLSNIMALMGGDFNAATAQTVTQYLFTVPKDDLDVALNIEAVRMRDVLDTQDLWEQERGAIEQEVAQDISNPEYVLSSRLLTSASQPAAVSFRLLEFQTGHVVPVELNWSAAERGWHGLFGTQSIPPGHDADRHLLTGTEWRPWWQPSVQQLP
jgi:hypothetical protein